MKKIILSMTLAVAVLGSAFAAPADNEPSVIVKEAFSKEFNTVKNVQWDKVAKENIYEARFMFNNQNLEAWFSGDGEFLGTSRLIAQSSLPILAANELARRYPNAHVVSVFEHSTPDNLDYLITIATGKTGLVLQATGNGDLTVYKRIKE
jgi:hypothetical protein